MAGNYPDVPGQRMAYDRDGSVMVRYHPGSGETAQLSSSAVAIANSEDLTTPYYTSAAGDQSHPYIIILFAEARDLDGVLIVTGTGAAQGNLEVSTNSTNGVDGTWTSLGTSLSFTESSGVGKEGLRTLIRTIGETDIKGIRYRHQGDAFATRNAVKFHVYGKPSTGAAPNRLRFWHPTDDQEVDGAFFDWGDTPRNADITKTFRIKNPSSLTAEDVTLTTEALTDTTPTNTSQHTYSLDATTFSSSLNIGDLAPGAVSSVITVRRQVPSNAALSLWWTRIVASATAYT